MILRFRTALLAGWVLLLLSGSAVTADILPVGSLSFDQFSNGYAIDLTNFTQPGGGSPVTTFLDLSSFSLTVIYSDGNSATVALSALDAFGDLGTAPMFSLGQVISATLTGTFTPTTVVLSDGSTVTIDSTSTTVLSDPAGPLAAGDFALLNVSTRPQAAPEPSTALLLVSALLPLLVCLRTYLRL